MSKDSGLDEDQNFSGVCRVSLHILI
jgi:hypothetical protein